MAYCDPPKEHRFKKGQSGNPNGLPKGTKQLPALIRKCLKQVLEHKDPLSKEKETKEAAEHIVARLIADAMKGNTRSADLLFDRAEGKPEQSVAVSTDYEPTFNASILEEAGIEVKSKKKEEK